MSYIQAIVLAIIEGITEFLPVSSTGHMAIASAFLKQQAIHLQNCLKSSFNLAQYYLWRYCIGKNSYNSKDWIFISNF